MFRDRVDEIKAIISNDFVTLTEDPEVIAINDFLSPLDITYLLDTAKGLTESISEESIETYRLSPYCHDFIRVISHNIAQIVNKPIEHLNYINLYNLKEDQSLRIRGLSLPKIQESKQATSPNGKVEAIGLIALSDMPFRLCSVPSSANAGTLTLAKTVDVDPEMCNNSIVDCSTSDKDIWFCTFKFAEHPREINEVIL